MSLDTAVFRAMIVEEFRLHSELFGGRRFVAFPAFVFLVGAAAVQFLQFAGTDMEVVVGGLFALTFAFGLHTGSIGFVGRDAVQNLLGDVTPIVFAARTLPVSRRRLVAIFLLTDAVYYSVLFLLPLALSFVPVVAAGGLSAASLGALWPALIATFALGIALTLALIALSTRGVPGKAGILATAAAAGLAWAAGIDLVALTPYAVFAGTSPAGAVLALAPIAVLAAVGIGAYDPTYRRPSRTAGNAFGTWHGRLSAVGNGGLDPDGLVTKSLLDVRRSAGGFLKVLFSGAVLAAVAVVLVPVAERFTGIAPSTGVSFGAVLGLTAFTTYNWLTQFDSVASYLAYPLDVPDVFRAKFRAFLLLGIPTGLVFYLLAIAWRPTPPLTAVAGVALLVGVELYLFGVTVYLTGVQPNEFLFDTLLFAGFALAVAVVLVPILVVGFVLAPVPPAWLVALALAGAVAGAVGVGLYRRAIPKWTRRQRE